MCVLNSLPLSLERLDRFRELLLSHKHTELWAGDCRLSPPPQWSELVPDEEPTATGVGSFDPDWDILAKEDGLWLHIDRGQSRELINLGDVEKSFAKFEAARRPPPAARRPPPAREMSLAFVPPMLPSLTRQPPEGGEWIHEIKHDGYRTQIIIEVDDGHALPATAMTGPKRTSL